MLLFKFAQSQEARKYGKIITHFLKVINAHVGVNKFIKLFHTLFERFKLDCFWNFDIFHNTISNVWFEVCCVTDTEAVPVDDFDLEHMTIY